MIYYAYWRTLVVDFWIVFVLRRGRQEKLPPPYVLRILSKLTFVAMIHLLNTEHLQQVVDEQSPDWGSCLAKHMCTHHEQSWGSQRDPLQITEITQGTISMNEVRAMTLQRLACRLIVWKCVVKCLGWPLKTRGEESFMETHQCVAWNTRENLQVPKVVSENLEVPKDSSHREIVQSYYYLFTRNNLSTLLSK